MLGKNDHRRLLALQQIAGRTALALRRLVSQLGDNFDTGWLRVRGRAVDTLQLGRAAAVHAASQYTSAVLAETGQVGVPAGAVVPVVFLASAPSGAGVAESLDALPVKAKQAVASISIRRFRIRSEKFL